MRVSVQELFVHVFWSCQVHSFNLLIQQQSEHMSSFPVFTFPWWHSPSLRSYFLSRDLDEFYPVFHCGFIVSYPVIQVTRWRQTNSHRLEIHLQLTRKLLLVLLVTLLRENHLLSHLQPPVCHHLTSPRPLQCPPTPSFPKYMQSLFAFQCFHRWDIIL